MAAIEMPPYFNSKVFRQGYMQQTTPSGQQGFVQTLNRSSPFWLAQYTTPGLNGTRYNEFITFLDQLEGSMNTFLAYDPRRPMPFAYRTQALASDPWTQTGFAAPLMAGFDYANSTLTMQRLQNGAIVTAGDYISFIDHNCWYLFRIQSNYVIAGNAQVMSVKPRPNIVGYSAPVDTRYRKACCEMKIIGEVEETDSVDDAGTSFKFNAGQFTNRIPA